jgi:hypothetical protein
MNDDYRVYDRYLYSGCNPDVSSFQQGKPGLSSDQLLQVSGFLDGLDESGAQFEGTVQFGDHVFSVGYSAESEEHYITVS